MTNLCPFSVLDKYLGESKWFSFMMLPAEDDSVWDHPVRLGYLFVKTTVHIHLEP